MSKITTATVAIALADAGRLDLDAPIHKYVSGYPTGSVPMQPTIRQLLNHTAGAANPLPIRWVRPAKVPARSSREFLDQLLRRYGRPRYPIGGLARYSNLGYLILAEAISVAASRPFESYVSESLLRPAGMTHTNYRWPPDAPAATRSIRVPAIVSPVQARWPSDDHA
jgi:CubicO group peptidase (beta-lactamase class C family)